eukprot:m.31283 g.31283  ORF g.31283 m.31283 type:complete len:531 (-) comp4870_c0_seq2:53-1645(-)
MPSWVPDFLVRFWAWLGSFLHKPPEPVVQRPVPSDLPNGMRSGSGPAGSAASRGTAAGEVQAARRHSTGAGDLLSKAPPAAKNSVPLSALPASHASTATSSEPLNTPASPSTTACPDPPEEPPRVIIAVSGNTCEGKSSLVNALLGERKALTGPNETTTSRGEYEMPENPQWILHDLPGAGTLRNSCQGYFDRFELHKVDVLIIVTSQTIMNIDLQLIAACQRERIPVFVVRSKSDQLVANILSDRGLDDVEAVKGVAQDIIKEIRTAAEKNYREQVDAYNSTLGKEYNLPIISAPQLYLVNQADLLRMRAHLWAKARREARKASLRSASAASTPIDAAPIDQQPRYRAPPESQCSTTAACAANPGLYLASAAVATASPAFDNEIETSAYSRDSSDHGLELERELSGLSHPDARDDVEDDAEDDAEGDVLASCTGGIMRPQRLWKRVVRVIPAGFAAILRSGAGLPGKPGECTFAGLRIRILMDEKNFLVDLLADIYADRQTRKMSTSLPTRSRAEAASRAQLGRGTVHT